MPNWTTPLVIGHPPPSPEEIATDLSHATDERAVEILVDAAEHRFTADEFGIDAARDAMHAVQESGGTPGCWFISPEDVPTAHPVPSEDVTTIDGVPVFHHPPEVIGDRAILVGEKAATTPPTPLAGTPIIVRHPRAIAVVDL